MTLIIITIIIVNQHQEVAHRFHLLLPLFYIFVFFKVAHPFPLLLPHFYMFTFFKGSHPFPLLLPLCKWCHLLFFSVLVVDRLSIKKG